MGDTGAGSLQLETPHIQRLFTCVFAESIAWGDLLTRCQRYIGHDTGEGVEARAANPLYVSKYKSAWYGTGRLD